MGTSLMDTIEDPIEIVMWSLWTLWIESMFSISEGDNSEDETKDYYTFFAGPSALSVEHQCIEMATAMWGPCCAFDDFPRWIRDEACKWIGRVCERIGFDEQQINILMLNHNRPHFKKTAIVDVIGPDAIKPTVDFWWYSVWQAAGHGVCCADNWKVPKRLDKIPDDSELPLRWLDRELVTKDVLEDYLQKGKPADDSKHVPKS